MIPFFLVIGLCIAAVGYLFLILKSSDHAAAEKLNCRSGSNPCPYRSTRLVS